MLKTTNILLTVNIVNKLRQIITLHRIFVQVPNGWYDFN